MNLKNYQTSAVNKLIEYTKALMKNPEKKKRLVLKSPTASGKTVMLSHYMNQLPKEIEEDVCFLWISIGKGGLHIQSKDSISSYMDGYPPVYFLDEVIHDGIIQSNEVVVVNWESLVGKNGELDHNKIYMREGEKQNFPELVKATNKKRKIILIIDESHLNMSTSASQELIDLIQPEVMVEASATPIYIPNAVEIKKNQAEYVEVDYFDVMQEGMVKKDIWVNENIEDAILEESDSSLQFVTDMALKKRITLKEAFQQEGRNVNPLLLIQIPNARDGEQVLEELLPYLGEKGYTLQNGNLAIWTSKRKELPDDINNLNSEIDVLIFKMAIATGWDCPRAHILLKLRETKSEVFDIQTVGRILRMPEREHYQDERLNNAYVYTNNPKVEYKMKELAGYVKQLQSHLKDDVQNIVLESEYVVKGKKRGVRESLFNKVFEDVAKQFGLEKEKREENMRLLRSNFKWSTDSSSLTNTFVTGKLDYENMKDTSNMDTVEFRLGRDDIEYRYEKILEECSPYKQQMRRLIIKLFDEYMPFEDYVGQKYELVLLNEGYFFKPFLKAVNERYLKEYDMLAKQEEKRKKRMFSVPTFLMKDEKNYEVVEAEHYAHNTCFLRKDRSNPERNFEEFLENFGEKLDWWYKNEDSGKDAFSILYEYKGNTHTFHPDYIVRFQNGLIGIYETKGLSDQEADTKTKAKAEALQYYLDKMNEKGIGLDGGIVRFENDLPVINRSAVYKADDWSQWKPFSI